MRRALEPAAQSAYTPGSAARVGAVGEAGQAAGGAASARPCLELAAFPAGPPGCSVFQALLPFSSERRQP